MLFNATQILIQSCVDYPTLFLPQRTEWVSPEGTLDTEDQTQAWMKDWDKWYSDRKSWEETSHKERTHALFQAANHIMCVNGNGVNWNDYGFPDSKISLKTIHLAKEFGPIPYFDCRQNWYPINPGFSTLTRAAGIHSDRRLAEKGELNMMPSFVELGLNIAQNIIRLGLNPRLNALVQPPQFEVAHSRHRMHLAANCYRGFRKRYPDIVFDEAFDVWMKTEKQVVGWINDFDLGPENPLSLRI